MDFDIRQIHSDHLMKSLLKLRLQSFHRHSEMLGLSSILIPLQIADLLYMSIGPLRLNFLTEDYFLRILGD
jgi:hypothetical protein